jgi:hypothetical protein
MFLTMIPGLGLPKIPIISDLFKGDDKPMKIEWLVGYIVSILCSMLVVYGVMKMPFKTPPMLAAACICSSCCSSSTSRVVTDVRKRI